MPWELKIVHIDLLNSGDATLLVARRRSSTGALQQTRSLLVDGGRVGRMVDVDHVIRTDEGLAALDVVVVTHYDQDHYGGITALMNSGNAAYDNCRIYDQGEASTLTVKMRRLNDGSRAAVASTGARETQYQRYLNAIGSVTTRSRVTEKVCSFHDTNINPALPGLGWHDRNWLVGRELLWDGVTGGVPANAPSVTCVAANQFVLQTGGGTRRLTSSVLLSNERGKNQRSLALLVRFGNFKYYVGGDLESTQENTDKTGLKTYLNPTDNTAGRVHAFKTSHHGSQHSTASEFLARIRARAAFVSSGTNNQFGHPDAAVVTRLENSASVQRYYITGEDVPRPFGGKARVCGVWPPGGAPIRYADATLSLSQAQAGGSPPSFDVSYQQPNDGNNQFDGTFNYVPYGLVTDNL